MTSLTFYGGVNEIGGNKFLLRDKGGSIFLDFGRSFARERQYFDEPWLGPRREEHLLALGILPSLPGLYGGDAGRGAPIDGILVSHPHTDHYDAIRWLRDDIPVYLSAAAKTMILSREYSGRTGPSNEYRIAKWTRKEGKEVIHPLEILNLGKPKEVGGMQATAYEVDHSTIGSAGHIIETLEGSVVYTGDFRLHGARGEKTRGFLQAAADHDPVALLIEGTHVGDCKLESEEEVTQKLRSVVRRSRGLVVAGFATADVDRLITFYGVAKATDRTLVVTQRQAFIVDQLTEANQFTGFDLRSKNILILRKQKASQSQYEHYLEDRYGKQLVDAADVKEIQQQTILVASLMDMLTLPDIDPMAGSVYILSSSEPLNEEMETAFEKLMAWLTLYGMPLFQIHASGHAGAHDLQEAVSIINPRRVFLVHCDNPHLYALFLRKLSPNVAVEEPMEKSEYPLGAM